MPRNALLDVEMRPTPRNRLLGLLADAMESGKGFANRAQIPASVPLVGGQGVGSLLFGQAPEELSEWSYGNAPMRINPLAGRTASYVPEMKRGRGQGVADLFAAAQVPGGKNALLAGMGALDNSAFNKAATVWHGSPHKFDKFDSSKIGTGEGAQAYGHGLYLAESPDVARSYQALGGVELRDKAGKVVALPPEVEWVANDIFRAGGDFSKVRADLVENGKNYPWPAEMGTRHLNEWEAAGVAPQAKGALYKVDLHDDKIARMLDWDSPLSQQAPAVRAAFPSKISEAKELSAKIRELSKAANDAETTEQALALSREANMLRSRLVGLGKADTMTGRDLYARITDALGGTSGDLSVIGMPGFAQYNHAGAAQRLRDLGIPGVRYYDGGSRTAGQGTRNYVVFPGEENALTILERNGQRLR